MNPIDLSPFPAFRHNNRVADLCYAPRLEPKLGVAGLTGEDPHHVLAMRWAMEPPLEVGGKELRHRVGPAGGEGFIEGIGGCSVLML